MKDHSRLLLQCLIVAVLLCCVLLVLNSRLLRERRVLLETLKRSHIVVEGREDQELRPISLRGPEGVIAFRTAFGLVPRRFAYFFGSHCDSCQKLWPEVRKLMKVAGDGAVVLVDLDGEAPGRLDEPQGKSETPVYVVDRGERRRLAISRLPEVWELDECGGLIQRFASVAVAIKAAEGRGSGKAGG